MANTIRNEIERIQQLYRTEWKEIELLNGPVTLDLTWIERFTILFTGRLHWIVRFTCNIKGEGYMSNPRITYKGRLLKLEKK